MNNAGPGANARVVAFDGLRGVAILAVLAFHSVRFTAEGGFDPIWQSVVRSGWLGVDLFFALSGFLITGILLDTRGRRGYYWSFFARRLLRIVPAYAVLLLAVLTIARTSVPPESASLRTFMDNSAWYWTLSTNILVARDGWSATPFLTGHLWSIGVEEQFYVVWALLIAFAKKERLAGIIMALWLMMIAMRLGMIDRGTNAVAIYVLPVSHGDGLLAGSLAALYARQLLPRFITREFLRGAAVMAGGALLLAFFVSAGQRSYLHPIHQSITFPMAAILFSIVVLEVQDSPSRFGRPDSLLTDARVVRVGEISYAAYLYHYPIYHGLAAIGLDASVWPVIYGSSLLGHSIFFLAGTSLTLLAALMSWHLLESPILGLKRYVPRPEAPRSTLLQTTV